MGRGRKALSLEELLERGTFVRNRHEHLLKEGETVYEAKKRLGIGKHKKPAAKKKTNKVAEVIAKQQ